MKKLLIILLSIGLGFTFWSLTMANSSSNTLTVVSSVGDPVSTSPTGPFVPATTAYLAGWWAPPQPDGGLARYAHIEGAYWIWMGDFIGDINHPLYFPKTFSIPEGAVEITGTMEITADNFFNLSVNDMNYGGTGPPDTFQWANIYTFPITNLVPGENHLFITAWEWGPGTPSGLVYKLTISYKLRVEVPVDIKPQSCPNPLNVNDKGVLPVAILGTADFDVTQVDLTSITLEGVSPFRSALEDVATPFEPFVGKEEVTDCTTAEVDGNLDLTLKFDNQSVVASLGEVTNREVRVLQFAGNLKPEFGGTPIVGEDVVVILKKK